MPVGEALIGATHATKVTALNPSLFQSGLFAKVIVGALVSLFVTVSTVCTVGVVVWRANYRSPGPVNDYFETWKNSPIEMAVLKNDKAEAGGAPGDDGDPNTLKLVSLSSPLHGTAVIMASQKHVKYTPFTSYAGQDTFQYVVTNGKKEATGNVTIKVKNHAPDPVDDRFQLQKNIPAVLDVLANDNDIDVGDVLKIVSCTALFENDMGVPSVAADGKTINWTPNQQYVGTASFAYTVTDGNDTAAATVFLTVVNNPPVAEPDEFSVYRSTPTDLDVLQNDHDPNGDTMEILSAGNQDFGFITFTKTMVNYTPKFNSTSTDSFDYTIWDKARDNDGNMFTSQANVVVRIINPDPIANNTVVTVPKNSGPQFINLNELAASPVAHITETMSITTEPQHGSYSLDLQSEQVDFMYLDESHTYTKNTYTLVYTPAANFVGSDEVKYQITDDVGKSAIGTISIFVVNNPPTPADDFAEVARNSRTGVTIAVLLNDTDPNGDSLVLNTGFALQPAHGRATFSGDSITYIPTSGYFGSDSFQYSVSDVSEDSQSSFGTVHVYVRNDPPVPHDDSFRVPKNVAKNLDVLANDVDPNQDILSIVSFTEDQAAVFKGQKEIISSNPPVIRYTPVAGQIYEETFQYTVSDGDSSYARTASVYVNVTNTAPTPVDEQVVSHWFNTFDIDLVANDIDENGDALSITSIFTNSQKGFTTCTQIDSHTVRVVVDHGHFPYSFSSKLPPMMASENHNAQKRAPDSTIVAWDNCVYTITDGQAPGTRQGLLTIVVKDALPVPTPDQFTVHVDTHTKWAPSDIIGNDHDDDPNDELHLVFTTIYPNDFGTVEFDGVEVDFFATQTGVTHITYGVTDGCSSADTPQSKITVNVINDPPVAVDDHFYFGASPLQTNENWITAMNNDYDPEGADIHIVPSSAPATTVRGSTLIFNALDNYFELIIPAGFTGDDSFTYQVSDGHDVSNFATVHVHVVEGQPPVAKDDYPSIRWSASNVYYNITQNDVPGQFPQLTVTEITPGTYTQSFSIAPDNQGMIYTPKHDLIQMTTTDVLTYKVTDGVFTVSAMIRVTFSDVPPTCKDDSAPSVHWRTGSSSVNALANDTDYEHDTIWISSIKPPVNHLGVGSLGADQATVSFTFASSLDIQTLGTVEGDKRVITEMVPYVVTDSKLSSECLVSFFMYDRAPVAVDDSFTSFKNVENFVLDVLANDYDPDAVDTPFLSIVSVTAQQGIATINYNPLRVNFIKGFSGNAILKYQITDGKLKSAQATITIDVQNRAPVCTSPSFQVPKSYGHSHTSSIFDLVGLACTDADGDTIELSAVGSSSLGTTGLSNNKATFVPNENHSGQSTISFTVTDRQSNADSTFTVSVVNQAPVATGFTDSFSRNQFQYKEYTPTISDPDNDAVTITGITPAPGSGGVQDGPTRVNFTTSGYVDLIDGTKLRFTQRLSGLLSVVFTVSDGDLDNPLTSSATAAVTIIGNPPIARNDAYTVNQGQSMDLYVMNNDTDPDGDAIWIDPADWLVGSAPTPIAPVLMTDASGVQFFRFNASTAPSHCQTITFQYKIKSVDGQSTATVTVRFTNCVCKVPLDIVYCVDSSGSIGTYEFNNRVRPFLVNVTNQLDIGSGSTQIRVGIVQFAGSGYKETTTLLTNPAGAKRTPGVTYVVNNMKYYAGSTNTKEGLQYSKDLLDNGRSGVKKLIIVLTDGEYNTGGNPATLAKTIYNTANWRIIAIAVGDFDTSLIKQLVKTPANDYFEVKDFDALSSVLQSVVTASCDS